MFGEVKRSRLWCWRTNRVKTIKVSVLFSITYTVCPLRFPVTGSFLWMNFFQRTLALKPLLRFVYFPYPDFLNYTVQPPRCSSSHMDLPSDPIFSLQLYSYLTLFVIYRNDSSNLKIYFNYLLINFQIRLSPH